MTRNDLLSPSHTVGWSRPFRRALCRFGLCHTFRPASDEHGCWGECSLCGKRVGYVDRATLRNYIETQEAAKIRAGHGSYNDGIAAAIRYIDAVADGLMPRDPEWRTLRDISIGIASLAIVERRAAPRKGAHP